MSLFALTSGGVVAQTAPAEFPVNPAFVWVDVSALSPAPQVGWGYASGVFTAPAAVPAPSLAQQAMAAMGMGLAVTSPSIPLAGVVFDCGPSAQDHISAEVTALLLNGAFADGTASVVWPDLAGGNHTMSVAQFKAFASAQGAYVAALFKVLNGTLAALPAAAAAIV